MLIGWALDRLAIAWGDVPTWMGAGATALRFGAVAGWSARKVLTFERERDAERRAEGPLDSDLRIRTGCFR
jgi:hypothetical protein